VKPCDPISSSCDKNFENVVTVALAYKFLFIWLCFYKCELSAVKIAQINFDTMEMYGSLMTGFKLNKTLCDFLSIIH